MKGLRAGPGEGYTNTLSSVVTAIWNRGIVGLVALLHRGFLTLGYREAEPGTEFNRNPQYLIECLISGYVRMALLGQSLPEDQNLDRAFSSAATLMVPHSQHLIEP